LCVQYVSLFLYAFLDLCYAVERPSALQDGRIILLSFHILFMYDFIFFISVSNSVRSYFSHFYSTKVVYFMYVSEWSVVQLYH
jgi:hypothetical protein